MGVSEVGRGAFVRLGLLFVSLLFLFAGCRDSSPFRLDKVTVISATDLKEKGNIPDDVFYSPKYEKLAVSYRHTSGRKLLAFYDTEGPKPIFYFESPYAANVYKPAFGKDLGMVFPLLNGNTWQFFVRTILAQEALPVMEADEIHDYVINERTLGIRFVGVRKGKFGIFPSSEEGDEYKFADNLASSDAGPIFRALQQDNEWIVFNGGKKSEPYEYISKLAFSVDGKVAYIARDAKKDWYSVLGDRKIKLKKRYSEIGQVFVHGSRVFFSGVLVGGEIWEIDANNQVLATNLAAVPTFFVRENGDVVYTIEAENGAYYVSDGEKKGPYSQIGQFIENADGRLFIKVKDKFALWKIVSEAVDESAKYAWMSKMFADGNGNIFALGLTSSGDFEFFKFYNN